MKSKLLKDLCFSDKCGIYGIPAIAEDYDVNKTRYLRITDISVDGKLLNNSKKSVTSDDIEKYILEEGDIVFARTGNSTGKSYFHESKNGRLAFAGFLIKFGINSELVNPKYLRYYTITNHYKLWVENFSLGSTRGNLNAQSFGECPIPLPERKQQDLLAKVLSDLDAKIEINNKINQELEAMAKTLYDYWFVQFDFPIVTSSGVDKPYKSSGGKMVFNKELKREIPEGWEVKEIINLCTRIGDGLHGTPKYVEKSDYSFINGNNLKNGFISTDNDTKKVSAQEYEKHFIELNNNSILLSINGTLGNLAIYNNEKVMLGKSSAYINCKENHRTYCYEYLNQSHMKKVFWNIATGSTIKNLGLESIKKLKILEPNNNLIEQFNQLTKSIENKRINIFKQNQKLSELRDWLLPMLMNGQVSVVNSDKSKND
ncbi:restriction endonuclease subunit S [Flavicella sediminum]|uniref:restriction endonuclease subunit S n=1 Tax=Flavicella sediminum TaxID=2585141 RepID=UPI0011246AB3|nr:restriction endonuclease subunit S [Flavicella sediminum]